MSTDEQESEAYVRCFLEELGFAVDRLPTSDARSADFRATRDGRVHVIEVKEKGGAAGRRGDEGLEIRPISRTNTLSSVICDADEQLRYSTMSPEEVRIAWIHCVSDAAEVLLEQAPRTIYGLATLNLFDARWQMIGQKDCLYFGHSDFPRCRDIDAAVVSGNGKWAIFLNEFSPRCDLVAASPLRSALGDAFDPRELVSAGLMLSCDGEDVDRSVESQAQSYVARKYGFAGVGRLAEIHCRASVRM